MNLNRRYRELHATLRRQEAGDLRAIDTVRGAFDGAGRLDPDQVRSILPPVDWHWSPGDTGGRRAPRAGRITLLAAYAATPPSGGNAVVTYTLVTPLGGDTVTLVIPDGVQWADSGDSPVVLDVPAGGIVFAEVTTANGAAGVSMFATMEIAQ